MRFLWLTVFANVALGGVVLAQGLPDEKQTLEDIRGALSKKMKWGEVELYNRWQLERDKARPHEPFDMAKHPFEAKTRKNAEGVHTEFKGLAIYLRSGPDSWIFNRLFFFEDATRMVGAKEPTREELFRIAYEGLRTNAKTRAWGTVRSKSVLHVHSITIPEEFELRQTSKKMEFLAEIVFDEARNRGRDGTGVVTKSATFRVTAFKQNDEWVMRHANRRGEFREKGFKPVPLQTLKRARTLADVDLDSMYGAASQAMEAPKLPSSDEIRRAFVDYYNRDAEHFEKLLGSQRADSITEIESVEPAPFKQGLDVDPDDFFLQLTVRYKNVTGSRNRRKLVRAERRYQARFVRTEAGLAVKSGRPVPNTERELEVILADHGRVSGMRAARAMLAAGERLDPTGGAAASAGVASGPGRTPKSTVPATPAATPTSDEVVQAFGITVDHSAKNFDAVLGRDMSKKVVDIESVLPEMKTMRRVDRERVQVTITLQYTWKRFDNALMRSRRQYDILVKARAKGLYSVTNARQRGREREMGKLNGDRKAVAAMPLYVDRTAKLTKKPARRTPPGQKAPAVPGKPKKALEGLLGGGR